MPLVIAPAAVITALFALAFMLAWHQWGQVITQTLSANIPVIGNVIAGAVANALESGYTALVYWLDQLVNPIARLILAPITAIENTIGNVSTVFDYAYNVFYSIIHVRLPQAQSSAFAFAAGAAQAVETDARALYNQSLAYANQVGLAGDAIAQNFYNQSIAYATQVGLAGDAIAQNFYNQSIDYANRVGLAGDAIAQDFYNRSIAYAGAAAGAATSYATGLAAQAERDIAAAITATEGYAVATATELVGQLATDLDNQIVHALSGIYTDIDTAVQATVGVIGADDPDILAALRLLPLTVPADLAGLASLAGVTTLTMARYLKECGIPNCQNLGQFGRDLQGLLGLAADASFLGLIAELIAHPSSAASVVESTFGDAISAGRSLFGELASV